MTTILDVASYLPRQVSLAERQDVLELTDVELRRYSRAFGYDKICFDPELSEADILLGAARNLKHLAGREHDVRYVLRPRTVRSTAPYPKSPIQEVVQTLGLQHAEVFTLNEQACAGALLALDTAGALLAADPDPDALALVLVGEKTYGAVGQVIPGMAVLGEATAAFLVSAHGVRDRLVGYSAATVAVPDSGMTLGPEAVKAFGEIYAPTLDAVVGGALKAGGVDGSDLALYLPHNVNKILCLRTADRIGVGRDRVVLDNIARTAHCWGADTFINLRTALDDGRLEDGEFYLMTSVGLGATFAAAVFRR